MWGAARTAVICRANCELFQIYAKDSLSGSGPVLICMGKELLESERWKNLKAHVELGPTNALTKKSGKI